MDNIFITYQQALSVLERHKDDFLTETLALEKCTGGYLAEDLLADRDFPPFDRVTMDGIAISYDSFEQGNRQFKIESTSPAGTPQARLKDSKNCVEVMTGTMVPKNADTVIRYEDLQIENGIAHITTEQISLRQSIHFKGMDIAQGDCIVKGGKRLSSAEINIAAAIGKSTLAIKKLPEAVIFSTGDELIDVTETPLSHQIRRSNVYGIRNTLNEWGLKSHLEHLPDEKIQMHKIISSYLDQYSLLFFTGGVSKGKYDYLPEVLESLDIEKHFHKIQQRPGKPFWFGSNKDGVKVFALPGNPVSSFVCVYAYFQYWLKRSLGLQPSYLNVKLKENAQFRPDLVYFLEAQLVNEIDGSMSAIPVPGNGSGDFANLVRTDGFLILPQGKTDFKTGDIYPFIPYRQIF